MPEKRTSVFIAEAQTQFSQSWENAAHVRNIWMSLESTVWILDERVLCGYYISIKATVWKLLIFQVYYVAIT
jgi:hypothetical protein